MVIIVSQFILKRLSEILYQLLMITERQNRNDISASFQSFHLSPSMRFIYISVFHLYADKEKKDGNDRYFLFLHVLTQFGLILDIEFYIRTISFFISVPTKSEYSVKCCRGYSSTGYRAKGQRKN